LIPPLDEICEATSLKKPSIQDLYGTPTGWEGDWLYEGERFAFWWNTLVFARESGRPLVLVENVEEKNSLIVLELHPGGVFPCTAADTMGQVKEALGEVRVRNVGLTVPLPYQPNVCRQSKGLGITPCNTKEGTVLSISKESRR
jgi:hypothetical protein